MVNEEILKEQEQKTEQAQEPENTGDAGSAIEPTPVGGGEKGEEAKTVETEKASVQSEASETPENAGTQPAGNEASEDAAKEPEGKEDAHEEQPQEKMITQSKMNEILQKRLAEVEQKAYAKGLAEGRTNAIAELNEKYGVEGDGGLDELIGNGQKYSVLNDEYGNQTKELQELKATNALLESGIDRGRFDDVKAWLAYNKQDVTPESIEAAYQTHPEWKSAGAVSQQGEAVQNGGAHQAVEQSVPRVPSIIKKVGGEPSARNNGDETEEERAARLFGWNS